MKTWIALFKGLNVGGNNKILMKDLIGEFQALGYSNVSTYIQSGNVVFQSSEKNPESLCTTITAALQDKFAITTHAVVLSSQSLTQAINKNPFPELQSEADAKKLHLCFLSQPSTQFDQLRLKAIIKPSERWKLIDQVFYLHTPEGMGTSKLGAQVEKIVGVTVTARNWRTVCTLDALASNSK